MKWTKKGGVLPSDRHEFDNYGKTLVINYMDYDDAGTYECEASNGVGTGKKIRSLNGSLPIFQNVLFLPFS